MTPSTFEIKIIQKQATPGPITVAVGTGNAAARADFLIVLPCQWCAMIRKEQDVG